MTREDARDFLALAHELELRPQTHAYSLEEVNHALTALQADEITGAAVIVPSRS